MLRGGLGPSVSVTAAAGGLQVVRIVTPGLRPGNVNLKLALRGLLARDRNETPMLLACAAHAQAEHPLTLSFAILRAFGPERWLATGSWSYPIRPT